jgi:hypothetical protein
MIEKITNESFSYMVGLFQGDGTLYETTRNRGKLTYEISLKDKDIIDKLKTTLSVLDIKIKITTKTRNTNFKEDYESIILCVYNKEFRDLFHNYVPSGKKSEKVEYSNSLLLQHYLRGLSDADGSLGITKDNRCFLSICTSSEEVKKVVCETIKKITGLEKRINRNKRDNVYNIVIYNEDAILFCNYLYKNVVFSKDLFIDRKFNKYEEIKKWKREVNKKENRKKTWNQEEDLILLDNNLELKDKQKILNRSVGSLKMRLWKLKNRVLLKHSKHLWDRGFECFKIASKPE